MERTDFDSDDAAGRLAGEPKTTDGILAMFGAFPDYAVPRDSGPRDPR